MSWTKTYTAQQIGTREHLWVAPPAFAGTHEFEQYRAAVDAAILIINKKVLGTGASSRFTVVLSGTGTPGHPIGQADTITVTVTNAN